MLRPTETTEIMKSWQPTVPGCLPGMCKKRTGIPARLFDVSSVAEDWNGLEDLLLSTKPSYYTAALDIIRRFGIFSGREKQIEEFAGRHSL